jgi:hypothetical protein
MTRYGNPNNEALREDDATAITRHESTGPARGSKTEPITKNEAEPIGGSESLASLCRSAILLTSSAALRIGRIESRDSLINPRFCSRDQLPLNF